jgi:hypothetical protein
MNNPGRFSCLSFFRIFLTKNMAPAALWSFRKNPVPGYSNQAGKTGRKNPRNPFHPPHPTPHAMDTDTLYATFTHPKVVTSMLLLGIGLGLALSVLMTLFSGQWYLPVMFAAPAF